VEAINEAIQEQLGKDIGKESLIDLEKLTDDERRVIESLQNEYRKLGERPADYTIPTGTGAAALQDSTEIAREDPSVLSALLGAGGQQGDPEIAKAREYVKQGIMTEEEFNDFVEKRNASYSR
jgi:hypothetical protein